MKAYVDKEKCIGCGMCVGMEPKIFVMDSDGKAEAHGEITDDTKDNVSNAIASCPVSAISEKE